MHARRFARIGEVPELHPATIPLYGSRVSDPDCQCGLTDRYRASVLQDICEDLGDTFPRSLICKLLLARP